MTPGKPSTDILDAVAIAAEGSLVPTVDEVRVLLCRYIGCENVASRSDRMCARHSMFRPTSAMVVAEVTEKLKSFSPEAADNLLIASRVGSADGDPRASVEILKAAGVITPPEPRVPGGGTPLIVQVGIILPGLPGAD